MSSNKRMFLVDVSSLFFRAFYAIRSLTSPAGVPTNAIYGFLSMITKLLKDEKPDYMVFCYDRKEPSFRSEIYTEYKAHRTEMPEDLVPQIPYIKKIADLLGIPSIEMNKYEADDLIGTLSRIGRAHKLEVFIVSGDKDFAQLVEPYVWIYDTMKNTKLDAAGVKEKWGILPHQMIDYLSLVGDSSDNIPGVDGIGAKGAQKLLETYDSLDGIYQHLDEIKGSLKEKLIAGKDSAYLSQKLVTIDRNAPIDDQLEAYHVKPMKKEEFRVLLQELGFKNLEKTVDLLPNLLNNHSLPVKEPQESIPEVKFESRKPFSEAEFYIEDLDKEISLGSRLWGFATSSGIFFGQQEKSRVFRIQGEPRVIADTLDRLKVVWCGFDLKSLWHDLGISNPICGWDSLLAAYVIKAGESLTFDRVYSRFTGELPGELLSPSEVFHQHLQLYQELEKRVEEIQAKKVLYEIDFPVTCILFQMEKAGIKLDTELLHQQSKKITAELQETEKKIFSLAGETFNVGSPKQLGQILFDRLKLPVVKKTKTGFSTDSDVLEKLKSRHPIVELVLNYRELAKLKSTYVDALPSLVKSDGRIHTTFNQAMTTTGRLSSTEPNLQNIPIRTERGAQVRKAFIAESGKKLLSADYSQIELRILAHYSEDKNMCSAFANDLDIHAATASEIFGITTQQVSGEQRRIAKAVNFGIAYGQGAFGLADTLQISRTEASEIIKKYFLRFPGVAQYIEHTIQLANEKGYVDTLYGRRRYVDELRSSSPALRKFGERAAINAPIQGTASDIVKLAMIELKKQISCPILLQVHDELVFEDTEELLQESRLKIQKIMESVCQLRVPLKVNAAIGTNWDEAH